MSDDDVRKLARELLDAEEAFRNAPTLHNTNRLTQARRELEQALTGGGSGRWRPS